MLTDPIADMLNRIRNAQKARLREVVIPGSRLKRAVGLLLVQEGMLKACTEERTPPQSRLRLQLLYLAGQKNAITGLVRFSRPGRRAYLSAADLERRSRQMGVVVLSTSQGVMTDRQARKLGIGGEALCRVW